MGVVMAKEELSVPGTLVKKSNSIIRTRITVKSVEASRILAHLVACIRTDDEKLQQAYSVAAKDIIPYIGGENYKRIKGTCATTSPIMTGCKIYVSFFQKSVNPL